ncbi:MAG: 3-hydroxybutyrate dehydrogenase, partial [Alphaproteobacteria bacterium]|nr:3-hydroxybutyrate dehydrogenase [Alphaproteobacteria bacterium]
GIGLAIAKSFAKQNSTVILNGLGTIAEIKTIIDDLSRQTSGKIVHYGADLTNPLAIEEMMKKIQKEVGGIDILINNAGVQHVEAIEAFPVKKWDQIIALNLSAYFHTIRHAVGFMKEKGWGRIINIASTHGLVASPYKSAYVAAKHGVVGLTKVVALETGGQGVTCNAICPGWVLTPLVEAQIKEKSVQNNQNYEEATREFLAEKHPSLAFVEPEHVAQMCLFLCSDAASQMTGSAVAMDGGWTAR